MLAKIIDDIKNKKIKQIVILTHVNPDYDAVCSVAAIASIIENELINNRELNKESINQDKNPHEEQKFHPNIVPIVEHLNLGGYEVKSTPPIFEVEKNIKALSKMEFDAAIICDVNDEDRICMFELLKGIDLNNIYMYDHHMGVRRPLNLLPQNKIVRPASSTCELILADAINDNIKINRAIMEKLYAGITTDTCCFKYAVGPLTERVRNEEMFGLNRSAKTGIDKTLHSLYPEDVENIQNLKKDHYEKEKLDIFTLFKPKITKKRGTYITLGLEEAIEPKDDNISVLFAVFPNHIEIKFRKGPNSTMMISELAKIFGGGGNEDRSAASIKNVELSGLTTILLNTIRKEMGSELTLKNKI